MSNYTIHLPIVTGAPAPVTLPPPLPPPVRVSGAPPVDFSAAAATAAAQGKALAFNKIGFHVSVGGNANGLGDWMRALNNAGVPFFLKSTDAAGPIYEAQQLMKANEAAGRNIPHTLVFRRTDPFYETPNFELAPEEAAVISWQRNRDGLPPELDPDYVWIETINEPGRIWSEWLAKFSLKTAQLALEDGYRYAALSWSTGVPERHDWESPAMLEFLRLAGQHPDQIAISIHEYSLVNESIGRQYPYLVGRFQDLFDVCDRHGIPRPTILITEWGWEYNSVPDVATAMEHIEWASWLYAAYPEVKGAAIWYLGSGFGGIANQAQRLIAPVTEYSLGNYFFITPGFGAIDAELFRPDNPTHLNQPPFPPYPRPRHLP